MGARINHSGVIKRILEACKINQLVDKVPHELAEKVVPVLISNPKVEPKIIIYAPTESEFANGFFSVPEGKKWKVRTCSFRWNADVNADDRLIVMEMANLAGSKIHFFSIPSTAQIASQSVFYQYNIGVNEQVSSDSKNKSMPLPDVWLFPGDQLYVFDNGNGQAGDTLQSGFVVIEERDLEEEFEER